LRSAALMLAYGLGRLDEARLLDDAVDRAIRLSPTVDLDGTATTEQFGTAVVGALNGS
jgi:isocitrate/isopropylmalate dehydrogenase